MACTYNFGGLIDLLNLPWDDWEIVEAAVAALQEMESEAAAKANRASGGG